MKNSHEYNADYFQKLKASPRYEAKKKQNRGWNKTDEGKKYKREYMKKWYADKREFKQKEGE